ncbi:MAG: hypothetical protein ACJLS3_02720 [Erythrobacter sp.]
MDAVLAAMSARGGAAGESENVRAWPPGTGCAAAVEAAASAASGTIQNIRLPNSQPPYIALRFRVSGLGGPVMRG